MGTKTSNTPAQETSAVILGSSTLPALILIAQGKEVQLGDVVNAAFTRSGLSVEDWDAQDEATRDGLLNAEIEIITAAHIASEKEAADQAAADIEATKQKAGSVEVVLLRDSNLGDVGEVVKVSKLDVDTYKAHGMIDDHASAIKYAKSQKSKAK